MHYSRCKQCTFKDVHKWPFSTTHKQSPNLILSYNNSDTFYVAFKTQILHILLYSFESWRIFGIILKLQNWLLNSLIKALAPYAPVGQVDKVF